jgi:hypothetical protein
MPAEKMTEIRELLQSGQKIEAIKLYRQVSGAGLKEAKDFVEALVPDYRPAEAAPNVKRNKIISIAAGLFFFGIASIFPVVFIPVGIEAWQDHQILAAFFAFFGTAIWAVLWGAVGWFILFL